MCDIHDLSPQLSCLDMYVCMHVYAYRFHLQYTLVFICMYVCIYACIYIYIYIYIYEFHFQYTPYFQCRTLPQSSSQYPTYTHTHTHNAHKYTHTHTHTHTQMQHVTCPFGNTFLTFRPASLTRPTHSHAELFAVSHNAPHNLPTLDSTNLTVLSAVHIEFLTSVAAVLPASHNCLHTIGPSACKIRIFVGVYVIYVGIVFILAASHTVTCKIIENFNGFQRLLVPVYYWTPSERVSIILQVAVGSIVFILAACHSVLYIIGLLATTCEM